MWMENRQKGSICVFVSFVLLLLLALFFTLLEGVYVDAGRLYAKETLALCSEGVLAQYEKELWNDYRILAYREHREGEYQEQLQELLSENFAFSSMLPLSAAKIDAKGSSGLLDDEGKWYQTEIASIMQYEAMDALQDYFADALAAFDGVEVCMEVLQAEMEVEESLAGMYEELKKLSKEAKQLNLDALKKMQDITKTCKEYCDAGGITKEQIQSIAGQLQKVQEICSEQLTHLQTIEEEFYLILDKANEAREAVTHFANTLSKCKQFLSKENLKQFQKKLNTLKQYTDKEQSQNVQNALQTNMAVLRSLTNIQKEDLSECDEQTLYQAMEKWEEQLHAYDIKEIKTLIVPSDDAQAAGGSNPLKTLQKLLKNGVLELVTDTSTLSENSLEDANVSQETQDTESEKSEDFSRFFAQSDTFSFDVSALQDFSGIGQNAQQETEKNNVVLDKIFLCAYGEKYFKNYTNTFAGENELPRKLAYEMEYQIAGKAADKDNLSAVVTRLLLIRTAMNYMYVRSDKDIKAKAKTSGAALAAAAGLAAFSGMIENALLLALAYEEALVDASALLQGKRVAFVKAKENFSMKFEEIALFGKQMVKEKSQGFAEQDEGIGSGFSYGEYLLFLSFLSPQKNIRNRQWRLIEENMKLRYTQEFSLNDCVCKVWGEVDFTMPGKFIKRQAHTYRAEWNACY